VEEVRIMQLGMCWMIDPRSKPYNIPSNTLSNDSLSRDYLLKRKGDWPFIVHHPTYCACKCLAPIRSPHTNLDSIIKCLHPSYECSIILQLVWFQIWIWETLLEVLPVICRQPTRQ
jgi:hypothetical protein